MALAGAPGRIVGALALCVAALGSVGASEADAGHRCGGATLRPTIVGTPGPDTLRGTNGFDVIRAGGGDDRIEGRNGADFICGGPGDDLIYGGDDPDQLKGGSGDDTMVGEDGGDYILGQGGTDSADGGDDLDSCLVEVPAGCESDVGIRAGVRPFGVTGGDSSRVYNWTETVQVGGSMAVAVYATIELPAEAEYVPGSAPACTEDPADRLNCSLGTIEANRTATIGFGFRLPDCPPPGGPALRFEAYAADQFNEDPFPDNNTASDQISIGRAPSCPQ